MASTLTQPDQLPGAELDVLAWLWQNGPATARAVREGLALRRPMTDGAAVTLLRRLERKGLLTRSKTPGRPYLYAPTRKPQPTYRRLVRNLADRLFGGDPAQLVLSFFEGRPPSPEELQRIERAVRDLKRSQARTNPTLTDKTPDRITKVTKHTKDTKKNDPEGF